MSQETPGSPLSRVFESRDGEVFDLPAEQSNGILASLLKWIGVHVHAWSYWKDYDLIHQRRSCMTCGLSQQKTIIR